MKNYFKKIIANYFFRRGGKDAIITTLRTEMMKMMSSGMVEEATALSALITKIEKTETLAEANVVLETMEGAIVAAHQERQLRMMAAQRRS